MDDQRTGREGDKAPKDPAEGVRIIGPDEAAEALERGDVASPAPMTSFASATGRPARPRVPVRRCDSRWTPALIPAGSSGRPCNPLRTP